MSQQFCYLTTPNVEAEAFRLLAMFDERVSTSVWNTTEAEVAAAIAAMESRANALETRLTRIRGAIFRIQQKLISP